MAIFWCFIVLVLLMYVIAMVSAIISWKRNRFPGWLFIPMVLLVLCPTFIFPIYVHAEYTAQKRAGNRSDYPARLKYHISWLPTIALFVSGWIFSTIEWLTIEFVDGPLSSTLAYVVALLFSIAILWLGKRLDKLIN